MTCSSCGATLPQSARFCHLCGSVQAAPSCVGCGAELLAGASFCSTCGTPASAAGLPPSRPPFTANTQHLGSAASERRQTSVLFADLVSYTTLSESRDTEDVRDLLTQYFEVCSTVVRRYGGTVEKFIGDAVMAVWGVPAAHEDDAERAVRAGLELVESVTALGETLRLPELAVRAGVVTGEVSTTVGAVDQGMVAGDPVNTAARVQASAGPGEVWVDADTRALTAAAVTYVDVGEHQLKGKAGPVRLFRAGAVVASVGGAQRVDGLEAPLAGRDRELRLIKELFHATEESGRPRLVVLDGEAGVGKSRLAWEFEKYIDGLTTRVKWHRGRCLSYGDGVAFWALAEALRGRLGLLDGDVGTASGEALERTLAEYVPDSEERAWLRPRMASLLGGEKSDFAREDLFSAWTAFFERLGDGGVPVVLVVDDAQYADDGLLDYVEHLLNAARAGMFVLLLARPELMLARPELGGRRANVIRLEPLTDAAMASLVDGLVDGLPTPAREALVERAEGVPLYAVETIRSLIDRDLVTPSEGRYVVTPGTKLDMSMIGAPASLHALVAARLDALTPDERRVLTDASVLGQTFTREGIEMLDAQIGDLDRVLSSLQRKEIITTETDRFSAERGSFRFVQSVVRQVAYSTLSRRDRKSRHLAVAAHLSAETDRLDELAVVIAQHLLDAIEASTADDTDVQELQDRVGALFGLAGSRACSLGSYADGLRLYESAISRLDDGPARAALQEEAAAAATALARYDLAATLAEGALAQRDAAGDPVAAARAAALLSEALHRQGRLRAAVDCVEERYAALKTVPSSERAQLRLLVRLAHSLGGLDRLAALPLLMESFRLADRLEERPALMESMTGFALDQLSHGSAVVGKALLKEIAEISRRHGLWSGLVRAHMNLGVLELPWSPTDALPNMEAAYDDAQRHGLHAWHEVSAANLVLASWTVGAWNRVEVLLREYAENDHHDLIMAPTFLAADRWRVMAGLQPIVTEVPVAPLADDPGHRIWYHHLRAMAANLAGDLDEAVTEAVAAVDAANAFGLSDDFMHIWPPAVRLALQAGDLPLVDRLMAVVADAYPGEVSTVLKAHLFVLRANLAAARRADPASVEHGLLTGIDMFASYGSPPYRAQAQEDLGRWLMRQGRHVEAIPLLEGALETYTGLGATAWAQRISELMPMSTGRH